MLEIFQYQSPVWKSYQYASALWLRSSTWAILTSFFQGDIIFCDPLEGVVVIPHDLLDDTLLLIPKLIAADDKVKEAVKGGMSVAEAFKTFRN